MSKQDLKRNCLTMECSECPFGKTPILCRITLAFHQLYGHSFNYIIKKLKAEIENVEKEIK